MDYRIGLAKLLGKFDRKKYSGNIKVKRVNEALNAHRKTKKF